MPTAAPTKVNLLLYSDAFSIDPGMFGKDPRVAGGMKSRIGYWIAWWCTALSVLCQIICVMLLARWIHAIHAVWLKKRAERKETMRYVVWFTKREERKEAIRGGYIQKRRKLGSNPHRTAGSG